MLFNCEKMEIMKKTNSNNEKIKVEIWPYQGNERIGFGFIARIKPGQKTIRYENNGKLYEIKHTSNLIKAPRDGLYININNPIENVSSNSKNTWKAHGIYGNFDVLDKALVIMIAALKELNSVELCESVFKEAKFQVYELPKRTKKYQQDYLSNSFSNNLYAEIALPDRISVPGKYKGYKGK